MSQMLHTVLLKSLQPHVKQITLYSNSLGGKNRIKNFATALAFTLQEHKNQIDHKFLEPGHMSLEIDSVHAAVENLR